MTAILYPLPILSTTPAAMVHVAESRSKYPVDYRTGWQTFADYAVGTTCVALVCRIDPIHYPISRLPVIDRTAA